MARTAKGSEFEIAVEKFFNTLFNELGFLVTETRRQKAGTQNGFDIKIVFLDDEDNEWSFFFECKDYTTTLEWSKIVEKVLELGASSYKVSGFIALSPKISISNIDDNVKSSLSDQYDFPIRTWTPDNNIEELFSLDKNIFKTIYNKNCNKEVNREQILSKYKRLVDNIINEKKIKGIHNMVSIKNQEVEPKEDKSFKTNLDEKLNAILEEDDPVRLEYHELRCNYKIFLEQLEDINNPLRLKIINWQDDLRLKAKRLTRKFSDRQDYTAKQFFDEFFDEAENALISFYSSEKLDGDREKLLQGAVFELAAECPLDWRKTNAVNS